MEEPKEEQKYNIFISHRLKDRTVASAVSGALRLLGDNKLEPFVCSDIPGGREWRDWIEKKIAESHMMLFLYTDEGSDWMWCFYEIGLFRHPSDPNTRPMICIQNPSIEKLPSPLEKHQTYPATEDGIKRFMEDLLYKGVFTDNKRINKELFANDSYMLAIQDFVEAFKPSKIESKFFTRRASFDLKNLDTKEGISALSDAMITSDPYTMENILDSTSQFVSWPSLYDKFKIRGQSMWLDQIRESIGNIEKGSSPIYVMKPFKTQDSQKFIPILTRVEQMPSEDRKKTIPLKIFVAFIYCTEIEEKCELIDIERATDPKHLLDLWKTMQPTSIIRLKWGKKSSPIRYAVEDLIGPPVVYSINPSFADLYNFNYQEFPDPDGETPLTAGGLLNLVKDYIVDSENYLPKIEKDQAEISQKIIFEGSNAYARVPLKFTDKHPYYPDAAYLPCLVSKFTTGDVTGPHVTYLAVIYIRGEWAV